MRISLLYCCVVHVVAWRWCLGLVYFCWVELQLGEGSECPFILVSSFGVYLSLTFVRLSLRAHVRRSLVSWV